MDHRNACASKFEIDDGLERIFDVPAHRSWEEIVETVPQILEETFELMTLTTDRRAIVDVLVAQLWRSNLSPRSASRSESSKVQVTVPQILEETVELSLLRFWKARLVSKTTPQSDVSPEATVSVSDFE